jgi:hypothetical protein
MGMRSGYARPLRGSVREGGAVLYRDEGRARPTRPTGTRDEPDAAVSLTAVFLTAAVVAADAGHEPVDVCAHGCLLVVAPCRRVIVKESPVARVIHEIRGRGGGEPGAAA